MGNFEGENGPAQDMSGHVRRSIHSNRLNRGQNRYGADSDWDVLDEVHIGATWRTRLTRMYAAAMRPHLKLLWPLVCQTNYSTTRG